MGKELKKDGFTLIETLCVLAILLLLLAIGILNYSGYQTRALDAAAREDLRKAYLAASSFFLEHPQGLLTMAELERCGFRASPRVTVRIVDGRADTLFLISFSNALGSQGFMAQGRAAGHSEGQPPVWLAPIPGWNQGPAPPAQPTQPSQSDPMVFPAEQGLPPGVPGTLLENCNLAAKEELQEALAAARQYFQGHPQGLITRDRLVEHGYTPDGNVHLTILNGSAAELSMSAVYRIAGATGFILSPSGEIAPHR